MKTLTISQAAQLALSRLLAKLNLIKDLNIISAWPDRDFGPIAWYARQGLFDENEALQIVAQELGIPLVAIDKHAVTRALVTLNDPALSEIPPEAWKNMRTVPYHLAGDTVKLAMANPLDHELKRALEFNLGKHIQVALCREDQITAAIARRQSSERDADLERFLPKQEEEPSIRSVESDSLAHLETNITAGDVESPRVVRLVNKIFADAVASGASDIHISPERDGVMIRVRVDGILRPLFSIPESLKNSVTSRIKLLCGMDISERRKPQDGRLRVKTGFGVKDLRLSTVPTIYGENLVIRVLSSDLTRITFEELGMPPEIEKRFQRLLRGSSRVVLVTGPTGSGKTSTLYASVLALRDGTNNIVTIEDPIEYRIPGINQIQVNPKTGIDFSSGLRSVLRQDPDVIMVGEIRDYETASIAMQAAQTGHLVLATLHSNSAAGAVTRLLDFGLPAHVVASSLGTVLAQRLVRRLCPSCARAVSDAELTAFLPLGLTAGAVKAPGQCEECDGTGYANRVGIFSLLEIDDAAREAIRGGLGEAELEMRATQNGFCSLNGSALVLLNAGTTSIEEVERILGSLGAPVRSHETPTTLPSVGLTKRRVLLVEDDENTRTVLSMLFDREMLEVVEACDGVHGLEKLYQNPPELIVCDVMMPRMDGIEFLKRVRRDHRTRHIPILMLTAADTSTNEIRSLEDGADDFVSKTSDHKVMLARVHRLLARGSSAKT